MAAVTTATVPELLGKSEMADLFGVSPRTVDGWIERGWTPEPVGLNRHTVVWLRAVVADSDLARRFDLSIDHRPLPDGFDPDRDLVGVPYIAEALGVKERTVYRWRERGKLLEPDAVVTGASVLVWSRGRVDEWLAEIAACRQVAA